MKSKEQKYKEAVERNIRDTMEKIDANLANDSVLILEAVELYANMNIYDLRQKHGIRKGDNSYDTYLEWIKSQAIKLTKRLKEDENE